MFLLFGCPTYCHMEYSLVIKHGWLENPMEVLIGKSLINGSFPSKPCLSTRGQINANHLSNPMKTPFSYGFPRVFLWFDARRTRKWRVCPTTQLQHRLSCRLVLAASSAEHFFWGEDRMKRTMA